MAEIGAIASIVGVAGAGAKLSLVLFEFASTVGSARVEVERVGTEISQFCAVLTQLRSTLKKARARRFSVSAISTTQDILERCQKIFQEIEDIVAPLQRSANSSKETSVDLVARVKWTFKRSKVQVLQKTLESSKNSLQLMLQVLNLAQKTATPRKVGLMLASTIDTILEDEQEQTVIRSLIVAQQCAADQLERLESEEDEEDNSEVRERSASATDAQTPTSGVDRLQTRDGAIRMPRFFDDRPVVEPAALGSGKQKRASTWVKDLIFEDRHLPSGFRRQTWGDDISSMDNAQQAYYLIHKWTDKPSNMINPSVQTPNSPQQALQDISTVEVEEQVKVQGKTQHSAHEFMSGLSHLDFIEEHRRKIRRFFEVEDGPSAPPVPPPDLQSLSPVIYVRALYDYEAGDRVTLSFHEGDVILVMNQLESGWWDGVINGVRGWFPSNYCQVMEGPPMSVQQEEEEEEEEEEESEEYDYEYDDEEEDDEGEEEDDDGKEETLGPLADFWIPQATPDGRLFYYNTTTGESRMELPQEGT